MIICIDSQVIVWGIKKQPTKGQEEMVSKAEYFFEWVDNNDHEIIIPTIVLGEILVPEPETIRAKYLAALSKAFIIVNFDTRAALKYSQLLNGRLEEIKKLQQETGTVRQKMKADHMIIATALVNNASCIYSYDEGLTKFASGFIDVREFPTPPPKQSDLFSSINPMDLVM
ncbi:MAG TPA: PIN domain-containing protein [Flavisolibacter sp.]|nr:PIN domain-containing protein [Flavisolibacter sp.]